MTQLIPPLTLQQYKQFYGAEFLNSVALGMCMSVIGSVGATVYNSPERFNRAYCALVVAFLIGRPLFDTLYAHLTGDIDYRIVRLFPHVFWKKWMVRCMGLSVGIGGTAYILNMLL